MGASGYVVNLGVYVLLFKFAGLHYLPAAVGSFLVAVANNYTLNRLWTFKEHQGSVAYQGPRFLVVSTLALGANLVVLYLLVELGVGAIPAQAVAIILVTPLNFIGNKLWSSAGEALGVRRGARAAARAGRRRSRHDWAAPDHRRPRAQPARARPAPQGCSGAAVAAAPSRSRLLPHPIRAG